MAKCLCGIRSCENGGNNIGNDWKGDIFVDWLEACSLARGCTIVVARPDLRRHLCDRRRLEPDRDRSGGDRPSGIYHAAAAPSRIAATTAITPAPTCTSSRKEWLYPRFVTFV